MSLRLSFPVSPMLSVVGLRLCEFCENCAVRWKYYGVMVGKASRCNKCEFKKECKIRRNSNAVVPYTLPRTRYMRKKWRVKCVVCASFFCCVARFVRCCFLRSEHYSVYTLLQFSATRKFRAENHTTTAEIV